MSFNSLLDTKDSFKTKRIIMNYKRNPYGRRDWQRI